MSTLKANKVRNVSATVDNLELDSSGNVSVYGVGDVATALAAKAPLASPALTGTPTVNGTAITALSGVVLIASESFSAASSISVNNCFSSTYDNYLLLLSLTGGTTEGIIGLRLRASGSDATGANYDFQNLSATSTTVSGARTTASTLSRFSFFDNGDPGAMTVLNMYGPAIAAPTFYISQTTTRIDGADAIRVINDSGRHSLSTAYDGISIICQSTGNITGTVRIYGYKNS